MIKGTGLRPSPDIIATIARHPNLSPEQEAELILKAQDGDNDARQTVIYSNLAWICSMGGSLSRKGIEDGELISEGYFGLNKAIDQWSSEKGANIRTFSRDKIYKFQSEAVHQKNHIRLPKSTYEQLSKLKKATAVLGEDATVAQLAEGTEIKEKRIRTLQEISQPVSLNSVTGTRENLELLDQQADDCQGSLDPALSSELLDLVDKLHPRQREILHLYHWEELSFQKISDYLGLPAKKVRKLYKQALDLLRKFLQGEINEFPPLPLLEWRNFVFAKFFLATGLSQIFNVVVAQLKRLKRLHQNNHTAPVQSQLTVSQSSTEVLPESDPEIAIQAPVEPSTQYSVWYQRLWQFVNRDKPTHSRVNTHQIDSGGLRDGPKFLLDSFWHVLNCIAQFLGYWPGSPRGSDQYRCRSGDRWRCRGKTQGRYSKKKVKLRIRLKIPLVHHCQFSRKKTKPKIEYFNSIRPFLRLSINQLQIS
ncbi:sigma-70 family RNA polymerase sigma factor [Acaryochloris marina]|uniref:RNA polymerase sigma factor domain protein n=1 Tax=Acaryochloris marina (strain MBIC 11017) TaxID=329726 RepID=A8ZPP6_ACAM1|nr:sigma-70 family RNA polymerase sigma factor [Acaryochloris marina]ABW32982.1 RNA polymerase sigma factor domain protein [Acaryochloris marina MBIC11017]